MAARLIQNQPCLCNCNSQHLPATSATSFSESPSSSSSVTLLPVALFGATNSARIPIRNTSTAVSLVEEPFRRPGLRYDDSSIVTNVPRSRTSMLDGRRARFAKMEGAGWVQEEVDSSRRVTLARATKQVIIMVDPVEAKRLAAAEMKAIEARAKRKRQTEIEANNGGWAMIGLTAGIVIDGYTGKSILLQIAGYLDAVADFLAPLPSS